VQRGEAPAPVLSLPRGRESEGVPQIHFPLLIKKKRDCGKAPSAPG
jgi:hypothetical protein